MPEAQQRKLAAIMFTDMVGYSALTQKNEALALELLEEHRRLVRPLFPNHGGKEIKTIGDAFLVEFASALEAARCAIEIQKTLVNHNVTMAPEKRIQVRIGLHIGDVVYQENDVLGDGVNIASRIEPLAAPGGICLSEDVARQIRNKIELPVLELGRGELKNIRIPVGIYKIVLPWEKRRLPVSERWVFKLRQRRRALAASALAAAGAVVFIVWITGSRPVLSFEPRDWVLVTDFENQTGDTLFDKSLTTAFTISMGQSMYANVYPKSRVNEALKRMKKTEVEKIDEVLGQEIAVREGIQAVVVPSITGIGDTYRLAARIRDPATGRDVKTEQVKAEGKDNILDALDKLVEKIRKDLGESLLAISQSSKPLAKVTTDSLEALKQYSIAIEKHRESKFDEAKLYYENALRTDPTFTAAKASLGMINFEMAGRKEIGIEKEYDREKGKKLLTEAVQDVEGLTEKEKYAILAFYARAVENDLQKAVDYLQSFLALYPDSSVEHHNLGWWYSQMGQLENAMKEYKEAIRIDPYFMITYDGLNFIYLNRLGDLDSAIALCNRQISYNDRQFQAYNNLGWAYLGKGNLQQARAAFEKVLEINPRFTWALYRLAHTHRLQGRYAEALRALQKIAERQPRDPGLEYQMGVVYQLMGEEQKARRHFERDRKFWEIAVQQNPNHAYNYILLGLALTRLGQTERGWSMGQKAMAIDPSQHFGLGQLLSVRGKTEEALDQLELSIQKGWRDYIWMKIHPDFQNLYGEQRFQNLIGRALKTTASAAP